MNSHCRVSGPRLAHRRATLVWPALVLVSVAAAVLLVGCGRSGAQEGHAGGPPPAPVTIEKVALADVPVSYCIAREVIELI